MRLRSISNASRITIADYHGNRACLSRDI